MSRGAKFLITVMGCLLMGTTSVAAQSGSTIVTAVVAPVRIIVVNDSGEITKVVSNTPKAVTPTVRKNTPDGLQITLTKDIGAQYTAITRHMNTHKIGVIYQTNNRVGARINLVSYLFRYNHS